MSSFAADWFDVLVRTTFWLTLAGLAAATLLRAAKASGPTTHRVAWLVVLSVGWTFLRYPVAVPWHVAANDATESAAPMAPQEIIETTSLRAPQGPIDIAPGAIDFLAASSVENEPQPARPEDSPATPENTALSAAAFSPAARPTTADLSTATMKTTTPPAADSQPALGWRVDGPVVALATWLLGIGSLILIWAAGYARFVRQLAFRAPDDESWEGQWNELLKDARVPTAIPLRVTQRQGPVLCRLPGGYALIVPYGLWCELNHHERLAILRHELAHYLRGDVWKSLVARLLALPHWFNPLAWYAVRRFDEAAEWACDRAAANEDAATQYARTLLRLAEAAVLPVPYGSAARGRTLAARVRRLLAGNSRADSMFKKTVLGAVGLLLLAAAVVRVQLVAKEPEKRNLEKAQAAWHQADQVPLPRDARLALAAVDNDEDSGEVLDLFTEPNADTTARKQEHEDKADDPFRGPTSDSTARESQAEKPDDPFKQTTEQPGPQPSSDRTQATKKAQERIAQRTHAAKKMAEEAHRAFEATQAAYEAQTASLESLYGWSLRWMNAAQSAAANRQERIQAARAHLKRMRNIQKRVHSLFEVGQRGGEAKDDAAAAFYVAEAERTLAAAEDEPAAPQTASFFIGQGEGAPAQEQANRRPQPQASQPQASQPLGKPAAGPTAPTTSPYPQPSDNPREVQILDLKIKLAELKSRFDQTKVDLELAKSQWDQYAKIPVGSVSQQETRHLQGSIRKFELERGRLQEQIQLYEEKLKLLSTAPAPGLSRADQDRLQKHLQAGYITQEQYNRSLAAGRPGPVEAGSRPGGKRPLLYGGKDFDTWADELQHDLSPERRKQAIGALAAFGAHGMGPQAANEITAATFDYFRPSANSTDETQLKDAASFVLQRRIPVQDVMPLMTELIKSDDATQRLMAVWVVSGLAVPPGEREPLLAGVLNDQDATVRRSAIEALLLVNPLSPPLIGVLHPMLAAGNPDEAMYALSTVTNTVQRRTGNNKMRDADLELLKKLMPDLLALLDRDEPVKSAARKVLDHSLHADAMPALEEALHSDKPEIRDHAQELLDRLDANSKRR